MSDKGSLSGGGGVISTLAHKVSRVRVELAEPAMGRHRRHKADVLLAVQQYDKLVVALHQHRPGERSGLCLICGISWPCYEVWLMMERGQTSGELR